MKIGKSFKMEIGCNRREMIDSMIENKDLYIMSRQHRTQAIIDYFSGYIPTTFRYGLRK